MNQTDISNYITSYFRDIYSEKETDSNRQEWFLSFIPKTINEFDNELLTKEITDDEIFWILKSFNLNKSPGIDGLPIEFYIKFFHIIKNEFCQILRNCLLNKSLSGRNFCLPTSLVLQKRVYTNIVL